MLYFFLLPGNSHNYSPQAWKAGMDGQSFTTYIYTGIESTMGRAYLYIPDRSRKIRGCLNIYIQTRLHAIYYLRFSKKRKTSFRPFSILHSFFVLFPTSLRGALFLLLFPSYPFFFPLLSIMHYIHIVSITYHPPT